jgi:putative phosphoribosyl transferase
MAVEIVSKPVRFELGHASIDGDLHVPAQPAGLVIFAHGSGSSRFSRRNRAVARVLEQAGFGTLLMDLLTRQEEAHDERTAQFRFDIPLLGARVIGVMDEMHMQPDLRHLPIGLFGASTGAAAALIAAAARPALVRAVISRGGRPDLAGEALTRVQAPTLLIVGGDDVPVIPLNRDAMLRMRTTVQLHVVPRATHLFEEPGALEEVAGLAADWCRRHLPDVSSWGPCASAAP